jgi:magnesium chelatase family protein
MGPEEMRRYCKLSTECEQLMRQAFDAFGLTARSYDRILKVARTIADLKGHENIAEDDVAEAAQYRALDKKYFHSHR